MKREDRVEQLPKPEKHQDPSRVETRKRERAAREEARQSENEKRVQAFLQTLPAAERIRIEGEALAHASAFQRKLIERGGTSGKAATKAALDTYIAGYWSRGI